MSTRRVALVTGAGSGIGLASCRRLRDDGYVIVAADLDPSALLDEPGVEANTLDVTDLEATVALVEQIRTTHGRLDALVCSAGIGHQAAPTWELDPAEWHRSMDVNLHGVFYSCHSAVPLMLEGGWGRIVLLSSIAGKEGNPTRSAYSASKAAVMNLAKTMGKELAMSGILVNAVAPAVIETPLVQRVSKEFYNYMLSKVPMSRAGQPEEVAALVSWLCSDECSFSTGAVYDISGGRATY